MPNCSFKGRLQFTLLYNPRLRLPSTLSSVFCVPWRLSTSMTSEISTENVPKNNSHDVHSRDVNWSVWKIMKTPAGRSLIQILKLTVFTSDTSRRHLLANWDFAEKAGRSDFFQIMLVSCTTHWLLDRKLLSSITTQALANTWWGKADTRWCRSEIKLDNFCY